MKQDAELAEKVLGPEVLLDRTQGFVWSLFWDLRRAAHSECGIAIPEDTDPTIASHLRALDGVFSEERSRALADSAQAPKTSKPVAARPISRRR